MNTPTYSDSHGNRYTTAQIEYRIKKAALDKLDIQFLEHGYNFCQKCNRSRGMPLDVSHTVSRKEAKEEGCVEKLWDLDNLEILCREHHKEKDGLNLRFHED